MTDRELLEQVARQRSEAAFTEIVRRHLDLVYSAALRQLGNPDAARDVAQNVFILLARQAARLTGEVVLTGWLYRTTRNLCLETIRGDRRRREREQAAAENLMNHETANPWDQIAPSLEPAMDELTEADRQAVLLRFFQNKSLRDVGFELGIGEDAAQKRVGRALEKLREIFGKRGVTLPAALLAATISGSAVQAAPAGILTFVTTAAIGTGLAAATTTLVTQTTTSTMNLLNLKTAAAVIAATAITGTSTYLVKDREANVMRSDLQTLNTKNTQLVGDQQQAPAAIKRRDDQIEQLKKDVADLPRLRGEVDRLNRQLEEMTKLRAQYEQLKRENARLSDNTSADTPPDAGDSGKSWRIQEPRRLSKMVDVGSATPEAAMQTLLWASKHGRRDKLVTLISLPPEMANSAKQDGKLVDEVVEIGAKYYSDARNPAMLGGEADGKVWLENGGTTDYTSMVQPNGQTYEYSNVVHFQLSGSPDPSDPRATHFSDYYFTQTADGWKLVIPGISPAIKAQ